MAKDWLHNKEKNPYLREISDNLNRFIENISCLRETYEYSEQTLRMQKRDADRDYNQLVESFNKNTDTGELDIPLCYYRDYLKKSNRKKRAERAMTLIPPSYLVSLVSLYDLFYAGVVRLIYRIVPEKLKESNKTFMYKDLSEFNTIQEVKVFIIDEIVEGLLRDSHVAQLDWLAKRMGISTLNTFEEWSYFVELTERRNLFVHSDGIVSQQYLDECKKNGVQLGVTITKGERLIVDRQYFEKSYKVLYTVGIKMSLVFANTIYRQQYPDDAPSQIDEILIQSVYDLICDELYDEAISISEFALGNPHFTHNAKDRSYIILNLAQAYKWSGQQESCKNLLEKEDCTAWKDELLIPKYTLEENYLLVYEKMKVVGNGSDILTAENYRQWPIFKEIRKETVFIELFKDIFDENLEMTVPIIVETQEMVTDNDMTMS